MPEASLNPELALILACCAQVPAASRDKLVRDALASQPDWERVVALAEWHSVVPQVHAAIASSGVLEQPATLSSAYAGNAKRSLWFTSELLRIHLHLAQQGIVTLAYKGPSLAVTLYGNVCERQFNDLDFIVRAEDVAKAKAALLDLDYRTNVVLTARQERAYIESGYEYAFDRPHQRNLLELHWRIQPRFYAVDFSMADLFEHAVTLNIAGRPVLTLCPEDLMLVLCVHASKHAWARISLLCDIGQLARTTLNWTKLHEEAARLGIQRIVGVSFLLAQEWLRCPIPESVPMDKTAAIICTEVAAALTLGAEYDAESLDYFRLMLRLRERRGDRACFLWRLLTTPSTGEWNAIHIPDALFPLYRGVRMCRLARRFLIPSGASS